MKRYLAQTTIAMLQGLTLILMAPAFLFVFVVLATYAALRASYDWLSLHALYDGDEQLKRRSEWRAP